MVMLYVYGIEDDVSGEGELETCREWGTGWLKVLGRGKV